LNRIVVRAVVMVLVCNVPSTGFAGEIRLLTLRLRAGFSGSSPIGEEQHQHFQQDDAAANFALPWSWYAESGWGLGTRLLVTAGALRSAGDTAFITTFVPGIALGDARGRMSLEIGGGGALLSQYRFARQDMGGPFQFVWDTALRLGITRSLGVGYCFQHLSDATIYGSGSRGFDLHMVEVFFRF